MKLWDGPGLELCPTCRAPISPEQRERVGKALRVDVCWEHGWAQSHDGLDPHKGYCPIGDHDCSVVLLRTP